NAVGFFGADRPEEEMILVGGEEGRRLGTEEMVVGEHAADDRQHEQRARDDTEAGRFEGGGPVGHEGHIRSGSWLLVSGCWLLVRATIHYGTRRYGTRHHRGDGRSNLRVLLDLVSGPRGLRDSDVGDRSRCDCQENRFRNAEPQIEVTEPVVLAALEADEED